MFNEEGELVPMTMSTYEQLSLMNEADEYAVSAMRKIAEKNEHEENNIENKIFFFRILRLFQKILFVAENR